MSSHSYTVLFYRLQMIFPVPDPHPACVCSVPFDFSQRDVLIRDNLVHPAALTREGDNKSGFVDACCTCHVRLD